MDKRRQIVRLMELKVAVLGILGLVMSIFIFSMNAKYAIALILIMLIYTTISIWQIENKYKKGVYRFIPMECKNATESRDIITMAPGALRAMTGNKRKNYDFLFEGEIADGQTINVVVKGGRDGVDYSVGLTYLLCFDMSFGNEFTNSNMMSAMLYNPSVDGELTELTPEVEETEDEPLESVVIIPDVDVTKDADNTAKMEILFNALNNKKD